MSAEQSKMAVETGYWPLFRYDPRRLEQGLSALAMDSNAPKGELSRFTNNEARFRIVEKQHPEAFKQMMAESTEENARRYAAYEKLSRLDTTTLPTPTT